jgi:hypothetical protein
MIEQRCIGLDSPDNWKDALQEVKHAFSHTWENCYGMSLSTGFKTYLYCFESKNVRIICPISEREFNNTIDIVTPYGFSGFTGVGAHDEFTHYWKKFAKQKGYVCGYIGLNPLFENNGYFSSSDYYSYNYIYTLDLTQNEENLFSNLSGNRKRQVKNWKEHIFDYEKEELTSFFLDNYHNFMKQRKASQTYDFSLDTLLYLLDLDNVLILGAGQPNKVEAISLFAYTPYVGDFLFNISLPEGKRHSVSLIWSALKQLKLLNIPFLNLGGGICKDDSLAQFKERFGGEKLPLACLKQVYRPEIYRDLCLKSKANPDDYSGYFPPYRNSQYI